MPILITETNEKLPPHFLQVFSRFGPKRVIK